MKQTHTVWKVVGALPQSLVSAIFIFSTRIFPTPFCTVKCEYLWISLTARALHVLPGLSVHLGTANTLDVARHKVGNKTTMSEYSKHAWTEVKDPRHAHVPVKRLAEME